jgi:hypothetical protein
VNKQLEERKAKFNDLVNKHMMMDKELVTLKKASESKKHAEQQRSNHAQLITWANLEQDDAMKR